MRAWSELHPKTRRIGERYGCERAPVVRGTVILVEVGKLPRQTREPKQLWLWWSGEGEADLALLWKAYCRRFDLEHTIRLLKQTLSWIASRFRPRAGISQDDAQLGRLGRQAPPRARIGIRTNSCVEP